MKYMRSDVENAISEIVSKVVSESPFGDVFVRGVSVLEGVGAEDEPYVHIVVAAADPDPSRGTWSREGLFGLRSRISELAVQTDVDLPRVVVDVHPEHRDEDEGSDEEQTAGLVERLDEAES